MADEHTCVPVNPLLYTKNEAAAATKRCLASIDYAIASGQLPVVRHGRRVYITRAALEEFALKDHDHMATVLQP